MWQPVPFVAHNEMVRRGPVRWQALAGVLLTVVLSPLVVVAGEPLRRRVLASAVGPGSNRVRRRTVATYSYGPAATARVLRGRNRFWIVLVSNPLWIALTAPGRWLTDRLSGYPRRGRPGPHAAGAREPRRPRPSLPGGAVALAEPQTAPLIARLLGTAVRASRRRDDRENLGLRHRHHSGRD